MKKLFLMATVACLALASCDDVPEPYAIFDPNSTTGGGGTAGATLYEGTNLSDWSAATVKGVAWDLGTNYAKASGYANSTTTETEAWLVSPAISLVSDSTEAYVTLDHVIGYVSDASPLTNHTMWISTNYSGDVASATWTQLEYTPKAWATVKDWTFYAADPVSIPSQFMGQSVYVAFKFICGASSTTWEVKNVKVMAGKAPKVTPEPIQTDFEHLSIADFIAKADANTAYEITGVASALNEGYGSLDLTEGDATVYVYKTVDASGNKVSFSALGIEAGDTVTVTGKYYKYEKDGNVKHELNPGTYVSHKKGSGTTPPVVVEGKNILAEGGFENWVDGVPTGWKPACTAGNATLTQVTEGARSGKSAIKVGGNESGNKRLGSTELNLKKGTYYASFYAKSTGECTSTYGRQCRPGYVCVNNGSVGGYHYSGYASLTEEDWTKIEFNFTLDGDSTVCLVVMAAKACGEVIIDDFELVTSDGGLGEGGNTGGNTGGTGDDDNTTVEAKGTGTEADPFNVAAAVKKCQEVGETATTEFYYVKGIVKSVNTNGVASYGNINVTMVDVEGSSTVFTAYQIMSFGGEKFTTTDVVKAGDVIVVKGQLVNYKGNTPETTGKGAGCLVSVNGSTEGGNTGGDTGDTGNTGGDTGGSTDTPATDGMTLSAITSAVSNLPSGAYGTQAVATDTTWVSWTYGGVTYKGVKICQSTSIANTIQMQGHASDAAKQGFIFNADAFASEIKTVTVVLKVKDSTSAYDPGYSLYAGSAAHPAEGAVEANASDPAYTVADGIRTYTQVFDLSGKNAKFFTIANDKVGALNIEKIIVTLK